MIDTGFEYVIRLFLKIDMEILRKTKTKLEIISVNRGHLWWPLNES